MGFDFRYTETGDGAATVQKLVTGVAALAVGDIVSLDGANELKVGVTTDATFVGVVLGPGKIGSASSPASLTGMTIHTTKVAVVTDRDAVYGIVDNVARVPGAKLDIAGASGAMTVAANANGDFVVVAPSSATQETLVRFAPTKHFKD